MDIKAMHIEFRALAQRQGMQNVRGILPDTIDVFLNRAIMADVETSIASAVNSKYQDKSDQKRNPITPINRVRTLFRTASIPIVSKHVNGSNYTIEIEDENIIILTGFSVQYLSGPKRVDCRIIDENELGVVLGDYCNAPSHEYPVVIFKGTDDNKIIIDLFVGNCGKRAPQSLYINYIKKPRVVKFDNSADKAIDCDLPSYTHHDIISHAVSEYFRSLQLTDGNNTNTN